MTNREALRTVGALIHNTGRESRDMSYAIKDLDLGGPPCTLQRLGNCNVRLWAVICDCGQRTKAHPLMSLALAEQHWHADLHRVQALEELRESRRVERQSAA